MNVTATLVGGLAGFAAWVVVAYVCHFRWPRVFTFNPLYFVGAAFTIETTAAYITGAVVSLLVGEAYALVIAALIYGFDATGTSWLVGLVGGTILTVISGTTLAYSNILHREVRSGRLGAPGMFAVEHGIEGVAALFAWHAVFGLVMGAVYGLLH